MDDNKLSELKRLYEASTPDPWNVDTYGNIPAWDMSDEDCDWIVSIHSAFPNLMYEIVNLQSKVQRLEEQLISHGLQPRKYL
jgi:hypothetical protein